jgi:hypothetical protein
MKKQYALGISIAAIFALLIVPPTGSITVDDASTNFELSDLTGATISFTYTQLLAMPKTEVDADLYCDGALVTYGNWGGVSLNFLLSQANLTSEVCSIQFTASDGYQVAIPIDLAIEPQIIIAYELNDQPLSEGFRLVIPDANGAAWIAKITYITMSTSGAAYPQAISVGSIKENNVAPTPDSTPKPSPIQQEIPIQPKPTNPENSSLNTKEATSTNVIQPNLPATNPQASNRGLEMQSILYFTLVVCAISFTTVAFLAITRKRKQIK